MYYSLVALNGELFLNSSILKSAHLINPDFIDVIYIIDNKFKQSIIHLYDMNEKN